MSATIRLTSIEITSALGSFLVGNTPTERLLPSGSAIRKDSLGLGISHHFVMVFQDSLRFVFFTIIIYSNERKFSAVLYLRERITNGYVNS